ncbi:head GIN domain-containing protein [uncultured Roseivirga sp.]|uniref:head GIN domain-containing protein n=1 Tax=uncultured Roseivirga sp. TaxID=543088 RepID=UPI000D795FD9|nr:head GIN domain-containing protein [uncultured Roseivirga sp.]PWL29329.1 MAG: hypothetical protein DCO95_12905 [Roseivirga sp. XM-24bin3]
MRRISLLLAFSLLVSLAWAQGKETRDVGNFDYISMSISGKVYVTQGNKNEVIVEADRDDMENIRTEVRGGRLSISTKSKGGWFSWGDGLDGKVNIYVTVKELTGVNVSGSGDVISRNTIKVDMFEASISGSGDIEIELDARAVQSKITGSGNIELSGSAQRAKLGISGSGKYYAEDLKVDDYEVSISGSGRAAINTNGELDVRISGSGSVYYSGNPTGVNTNVSGSGRVRRNN